MTSRPKFAALTCTAVLICVCTPALAVVIDFEDLPHADELTGVGTVYYSKGFSLRYAPAADEPYPVGFTAVGPSWRFNGRSAALLANSCSATTTLVADDNNPLTLKKIDLAATNGDANVSVSFVGLKADGTTVEETFQLSEKKIWKTYHFPAAFTKLMSVAWTQGDCIKNPPHMFDNIRVTPTWKDNKGE